MTNTNKEIDYYIKINLIRPMEREIFSKIKTAQNVEELTKLYNDNCFYFSRGEWEIIVAFINMRKLELK